jgi:hypothetical protein
MREDGTRGGGFESGASFWSGKNVLAVYSVLVSFFFLVLGLELRAAHFGTVALLLEPHL